jgi:hypothetical protein
MKNINNKGEDASATGEENQMKKLVMFAAGGLKLARKIYDKLLNVEDSIEIIAREIKRGLDKGE